jgi:hypothetical protein
MSVFVYMLIVALHVYTIALVQLGHNIYRTENIKFWIFFNMVCRGFMIFTRSDKWLRSLMPVTVQLLSPPNKTHTKQKN